jgi:FAD/FMN-containing dehydrogenase
MSGLNKTEQAWLQEKFGDLVNFDRNERVLYSHDIAAMPGLFKPLIGNTIPDAVVQPSSENLLQDLVRWAVLNKIPLTPRGKASSGYGGVLPTQKGIVIDFYRMKKVLKVDKAAQTVTVQPGITWEQLDRVINPQ